MCQIAWCQFSWEAFATIFSGMLAVAGAVVIGWRQLRISSKQTDILAEQTKFSGRQLQLEETRLKSELFDRRFAVYNAVQVWLSEILSTAAEPSAQTRTEMLGAIDRSKFLFDLSVGNSLHKLYELGVKYVFASKQAGNPNAQGGDYPQIAYDTGLELTKKLSELHSIFGDGMKLEAATISAAAKT